MTSEYKLVPTTAAVYGAIWAEHSKDMTVFRTISHTAGDPHGDPERSRMFTEWGFKNADIPTLVCDETWRNDRERPGLRTECEWKYYLCAARLPG